jgi:hypothetical protein
MARLRSHYTSDEIITDLYTYGNEWMYEDNIQYIGLYHRYTTGEVYTEPIWQTSLSKKLIPYADVSTAKFKYKKLTNIKTEYQSVNTHLLEITNDNIKAGFVIRYFISKVNERRIFEISKNTYDAYNSSLIDPNLYSVVSIKWTIVGVATTKIVPSTYNQVPDLYYEIGVAEKNKKEILNAEQYMPGISLTLNNPLAFYTDTEYKVPTDINDPNFIKPAETDVSKFVIDPSKPVIPDYPLIIPGWELEQINGANTGGNSLFTLIE